MGAAGMEMGTKTGRQLSFEGLFEFMFGPPFMRNIPKNFENTEDGCDILHI